MTPERIFVTSEHELMPLNWIPTSTNSIWAYFSCERLALSSTKSLQTRPFGKELWRIAAQHLQGAEDGVNDEEWVRERESRSVWEVEEVSERGKWERKGARGRENLLKGSIFVGGEKNNCGNSIRRKARSEAGQKGYQRALTQSQFSSFFLNCCVWGFNLLQPAWFDST